MLGTVCKGLHCAGCKPQFSIPGPVIAVIVCLIYRRQIGIILTDLIIGAAVFALAVMVLGAIVYPIMMRILMPHGSTRNAVLYTSDPARFFGAVEAHSGNQSSHQKGLANPTPDILPVSYNVEVLPREAYEWQETGQFKLPKRSDQR